MRALITGGAGFIGSHIADLLLEQGHEILILDNLSSGHEKNIPAQASFEQIDVTTAAASEWVVRFKPSAIFHLAAQMDVRASVHDPCFDAKANIVSTIQLARGAIEARTSVFILASTGGAIYGEQSNFPAEESHPRCPVSPYGTSKLCAEHYLDYFSRCEGLRSIPLRYANVYGPRQDPHGEAGVVAIFAGQMLRNQTPTIFGDGKQTRDYVFVGDVARANLLAWQAEDLAGPINIGTGIETDVNTLAKHLAQATGYCGNINHADAKPGEQLRSVLSWSRAQKALGWQPQVSLAHGIQQTADWFAQSVTS